MGNGRLREPDAFFDIPGAQSDALSNGARAAFLQSFQNATPGWIGDGVEGPVERGLWGRRRHEWIRNSWRIDECQYKKSEIKEARQLSSGRECLLLQDRIVTIADEPGAHGFRILDVGKGPDLNMEELIRARSIGRSGILFFL